MPVTVVNFSHPLTPALRAQLATLLGEPVAAELGRTLHLDDGAAFEGQVRAAVDALGLAPADWQAGGLVVVLPGYAPAAALVLAEIHGRAGHFPAVLRLRPVAGALATTYELAEVINLQAVRLRARAGRG